MVLNTKFWSFPVHAYQKQSFLMISLSVRGRENNLVIDRNSIVKKWKFEKLSKTHVIYLERKLRTFRIQIQVEKVWFVRKKLEKKFFILFKGGTLWCQNGLKIFFCIGVVGSYTLLLDNALSDLDFPLLFICSASHWSVRTYEHIVVGLSYEDMQHLVCLQLIKSFALHGESIPDRPGERWQS